jgi:lipopolysaccharide transport system permease protein
MQPSEVLVIDAASSDSAYWRDLWRYRELFFFLAWRDILVRYKQTIIGISWALIRPVLTTIIFTVLFGHIAKMPIQGRAYAVMVFAAMLPWQLFSNAFAGSSASLVANANLISKVYFPRLIIPLSAIIVGFVEFFISLGLLFILMLIYGVEPTWRLITLPFFTFIAFLAALGPSLWIGALNVKYRDFAQIVPFLMQLGLYVSPVGFSSQIVPQAYRSLYSLNPMVGVIDGFRWAVLGESIHLDLQSFGLSIVMIFVILVTGLNYFRSVEKSFADVI